MLHIVENPFMKAMIILVYIYTPLKYYICQHLGMDVITIITGSFLHLLLVTIDQIVEFHWQDHKDHFIEFHWQDHFMYGTLSYLFFFLGVIDTSLCNDSIFPVVCKDKMQYHSSASCAGNQNKKYHS